MKYRGQAVLPCGEIRSQSMPCHVPMNLYSNIQQDPPGVKKYFDPHIFPNPLATQVTSNILEPHPRLSFLSGKSALPPTPGSPPMSRPIIHLDANFEHPKIPFALVVNVPLVEMTPESGSTEVWLGIHHSTIAS